MPSPLLAVSWSDLLAAGLVLAFIGLVFMALRASLETRPRRRGRMPPAVTPAAPSASTNRLLRSRLDRIETRLAHLEQQVRLGGSGLAREEGPSRDRAIAASGPLRLSGPAFAEEVCALADIGRTPLEIAQHLGEPVGRVELILNLRSTAPIADRRAGGDTAAAAG